MITHSLTKQLINQQSSIQTKILKSKKFEMFEIEACEIIAYLAILDYWKFTYPLSENLRIYQKNTDEEWECIDKLFNDYLSDKKINHIETDIIDLIKYFNAKFYPSNKSNIYFNENIDDLNNLDLPF